MLTKYNRFHRRNALKKLYRDGRSVRARFVQLKYIINPRQEAFRAAVVVSRKVSKSAPKRNRIRRRVYEIIRSHQEDINPQADFAIAVFDDRVTDMPSGELKGMIEKLLKDAKLIA